MADPGPNPNAAPRTGTALLVSELGGGFGHVVPLLRLADALAAEGFAPVFAARNVQEVWPALRGTGYAVVQAPVHHPGPADRPAGLLAGYVDVLTINGFRSVESLLPLVRAWEGLLAAVRPALVVADYSPGVVLAAAGSTPVVQVGAGFMLPPADQTTFPRLVSDGTAVGSEADVLAAVRGVQAARGRPLPACLPELFRTPRVVAVLSDLDPYRSVRREAYAGPFITLPAPTPTPATGRYFAYLNATGISDDALTALAATGLPGAVCLRGAGPGRVERLRRLGVPVGSGFQDCDAALGGASVVVHHGGINTAQAALASGRPQVVLPEHLEHLLTAHLLGALGVGVKLLSPTAEAFAAACRDAARSGPLAAAAGRVAADIQGSPHRDGLPTAVRTCQRAVAARP